jgi:alpha-beta hydrolase superfamily lysophospholipase
MRVERGFVPLMAAALTAVCLAVPARIEAVAQRLNFRAEDGVLIAATWYEPSSRPFDAAQGRPAVILLHMLSRTRRDWEPVASRLASEGIGALVVDFRGHGDSGGHVDRGESPDFTPLLLDVKAARRFLAGRSDVQPTRVGLGGASLGANVAALHASGDASIASLALLSPSLDYRGLRIEQALRQYGGRPALLVASDDDPYAMRSVRELQKAGGGLREPLILNHAGHGTIMLSRDGDLGRRLVDWFRRTL